MADQWIGKARASMKRRGTVGALRKTASSKGLLSGKGDTLTEKDLSTLAATAKRTGNKELARRVNFARNVRKG